MAGMAQEEQQRAEARLDDRCSDTLKLFYECITDHAGAPKLGLAFASKDQHF